MEVEKRTTKFYRNLNKILCPPVPPLYEILKRRKYQLINLNLNNKNCVSTVEKIVNLGLLDFSSQKSVYLLKKMLKYLGQIISLYFFLLSKRFSSSL
jgi:hypothetical protein